MIVRDVNANDSDKCIKINKELLNLNYEFRKLSQNCNILYSDNEVVSITCEFFCKGNFIFEIGNLKQDYLKQVILQQIMNYFAGQWLK